MVGTNMDFSRQYRIYDPSKSDLDVTIIGAGSTGSFVALNLAKMGIQKIKVIDFDIVEAHNIPNQFYRFSDINKLKVDALGEIIKDFAGIDIIKENIKIDDDYNFDINLNSIVILCLDNMEGRELIFKKLKDYPINLIDTRFGGEGYSVHAVDLGNNKEKEIFSKSLEGEIKETSCGEKGIIYTILSLASEICNIIKKLDLKEPSPILLRRELKTYRFIAKMKEAKDGN